ncbi:hypothetical protein CF327_g5869 [Tilletia walkeri]|nr:hypothetical protein CF327_g5869 [Tilletia walkeri]
MATVTPSATMDAACSTTIVGLINVDTVKRRGNSNYYDIECQHAMMEGDPVDATALLYTEGDPPGVDEVWQVSGTWIPTANPFLYIDSYSRVLRADGDLPDAFEPACPTVCVLCVVLEFDPAANKAVVRMVKFDRRTSRRQAQNGVVLRPGRRWDKAPPLRVGGLLHVRGIIHSQNDVTRLFHIAAESITFLPMSTASDATSSTPSPKKRKFVRKGSTTNVVDDNQAEASGSALPDDPSTPSGGPFPPPPPPPSTPTPQPATRGGKGKGKATQ